MTHDRTYWRACDTARLIEEARDSGHELCIALGERLAAKSRLKDELAELRNSLDLARAANVGLRCEIEALERNMK